MKINLKFEAEVNAADLPEALDQILSSITPAGGNRQINSAEIRLTIY